MTVRQIRHQNGLRIVGLFFKDTHNKGPQFLETTTMTSLPCSPWLPSKLPALSVSPSPCGCFHKLGAFFRTTHMADLNTAAIWGYIPGPLFFGSSHMPRRPNKNLSRVPSQPCSNSRNLPPTYHYGSCPPLNSNGRSCCRSAGWTSAVASNQARPLRSANQRMSLKMASGDRTNNGPTEKKP